MNVIVLGGSGFIGQAVCVKLAEHGFRVTSLSRSGGKNVKEEWKHHPSITWQKTDVFDFSSWQSLLSAQPVVINLIGLLKENKKTNQTFQRYHVDLQRGLLPVLIENEIPHYLYLSAAGKSPWMSPTYLTTKKQAEALITQAPLSSLIIQSGLVVDKDRPSSLFFGYSLAILKYIPFISQKVQNVLPITRDDLSSLIVNSLIQKETGIIQTFNKKDLSLK